MLAYLTVEGVWFYRWYEQGVTDPEDLCWLIEFYRGQSGWKPVLAMGAMTAARRYIEG